MNINSKRILALVNLGLHIKNYSYNDPKYSKLDNCIEKSIILNKWFTRESITNALKSWAYTLESKNIEKWLSKYQYIGNKPRVIGLILAGNIPMVGFHDIICVWVTGNNALVKCASKDEVLLPYMTDFLDNEIMGSSFNYVTKINLAFDAIIATGSNNSARYFEYYFNAYPNLLRKNRNGIAILDGNETEDDLFGLGNDILHYFGLGCRNVAKVFLPKGYDLNKIFKGLYKHKEIIHHNKYLNNYDYNKAILLMNKKPFLDNGFFLLKEDIEISTPIGCLNYQYYENTKEVMKEIEKKSNLIQCIVTNLKVENAIPFGKSQQPTLWDYADGIDTINFLQNL